MKTIEVTRIKTEHGSHIEPPLRQWWSDFRKLRWHAAVTSLDCGVHVRVGLAKQRTKIGGVWVRQFGLYDVTMANRATGGYKFAECWTYLNGFGAGAETARELGGTK